MVQQNVAIPTLAKKKAEKREKDWLERERKAQEAEAQRERERKQDEEGEGHVSRAANVDEVVVVDDPVTAVDPSVEVLGATPMVTEEVSHSGGIADPRILMPPPRLPLPPPPPPPPPPPQGSREEDLRTVRRAAEKRAEKERLSSRTEERRTSPSVERRDREDDHAQKGPRVESQGRSEQPALGPFGFNFSFKGHLPLSGDRAGCATLSR